jgi:hypothetical protein
MDVQEIKSENSYLLDAERDLRLEQMKVKIQLRYAPGIVSPTDVPLIENRGSGIFLNACPATN